MDIKAYISSGILESYALGLTTPEQNSEIEALAQKHPEIKAEIDAIRASLEAYILQHEQLPPASLKKRVLHTLDQLTNEDADSEDEKKFITPTGTRPHSRSRWYAPLAAAVTLLMISIGINIWLYSRWQQTRLQLAEARTTNERIANTLQVNEQRFAKATEELAALQNPNNEVVVLKGLEVAPKASVVVYWDKNQHQVRASIHNLPPPPTGKQYQLWAIIDNKPVDAGMLEFEKGLQQMKDIPQAQVFAITLENAGGNPTPQGEMYVLGNV